MSCNSNVFKFCIYILLLFSIDNRCMSIKLSKFLNSLIDKQRLSTENRLQILFRMQYDPTLLKLCLLWLDEIFVFFQALVFPQTKLPDEVVAPVLSPFPRRTSFELPRMPKDAKLSSSDGADISPQVYCFVLYCQHRIKHISDRCWSVAL